MNISEMTLAEAKAERAAIAGTGTRINRAVWAVAIGVMIYGAGNVTMLLLDHGVPWGIAWMLSPMVDAALCVALWAGRTLSRYGEKVGWVIALRNVSAFLTWALNAARPALHFDKHPGGSTDWSAWAPDWIGVGIHSVGPVLLWVIAEAAGHILLKLARIIARLDSHITELDAKEAAERERAEADRRAAEQRAEARAARRAQASPTVTGQNEPAWPARPSTPAHESERAAAQYAYAGAGARSPLNGATGPGAAIASGSLTTPLTDPLTDPGARPAQTAQQTPGDALTTPETAHPHGERTPLTVVPGPRPEAPGRLGATADAGVAQDPTRTAPGQTEGGTDADGDAGMRAFWEAEIAKGNRPSGAELARVGGVSEATGKRRRAQWERELAGQTAGGADDAATA